MSGPGKSYRQGITIIELLQMFPDDATSEKWFEDARWRDGVRCAHCNSDRVKRASHMTMPYHCAACRRFFSVKTNSVMHASKVGYQKWAMAVYLMTTSLKGVSSMKMHRDIGVTQRTAWHMAHRIREGWMTAKEAFCGPVEADETYVGGKESNKHADKKLRAGRGAVGKTAVAGVKDRATNRVGADVVESTDAPTLQAFVRERTKRDAVVYTDEARAYIGLPRAHEAISHSAGEYVRGRVHTNGIESFWATLKRGYVGVYHWMSVKHLSRYVNEFAGRHNTRPLDTESQMIATVRGMIGKRLRFADLIADAPRAQGRLV